MDYFYFIFIRISRSVVGTTHLRAAPYGTVTSTPHLTKTKHRQMCQSAERKPNIDKRMNAASGRK